MAITDQEAEFMAARAFIDALAWVEEHVKDFPEPPSAVRKEFLAVMKVLADQSGRDNFDDFFSEIEELGEAAFATYAAMKNLHEAGKQLPSDNN